MTKIADMGGCALKANHPIKKLELSCNSKTKFSKYGKNTFGLMFGLPKNGGTCPGATCGKGGCLDTRDGLKRQTCYMVKVVQIYKGVGEVLTRNTNLLKDKTVDEQTEIIRNTISQFVKKTPADQLYFRLNYSGDLFSEDTAKAWAVVMKEFPNVRFWTYTRSHDFIVPLLGINNLSLYLSCDPSNYEETLLLFNKYKDKYPNLGLAYMGNNPPSLEGSDRFIVCPETSGKLKNTIDKGACASCRICIDNYKLRIKNIAFVLH